MLFREIEINMVIKITITMYSVINILQITVTGIKTHNRKPVSHPSLDEARTDATVTFYVDFFFPLSLPRL
jgi:hypothetical protein